MPALHSLPDFSLKWQLLLITPHVQYINFVTSDLLKWWYNLPSFCCCWDVTLWWCDWQSRQSAEAGPADRCAETRAAAAGVHDAAGGSDETWSARGNHRAACRPATVQWLVANRGARSNQFSKCCFVLLFSISGTCHVISPLVTWSLASSRDHSPQSLLHTIYWALHVFLLLTLVYQPINPGILFFSNLVFCRHFFSFAVFATEPVEKAIWAGIQAKHFS